MSFDFNEEAELYVKDLMCDVLQSTVEVEVIVGEEPDPAENGVEFQITTYPDRFNNV